MKSICSIIALIALTACNTSKEIKNSNLILTEAYQQTWYGGQPGVQGTKYTILLKSQNQIQPKFDSIFIENQWSTVRTTGNNPWTVTTSITQDYRQNTELSETNPDEFRDVDIDVKIIRPDNNEKTFYNQNVIAYSLKGKPYYIEIKSFQNKESISYP